MSSGLGRAHQFLSSPAQGLCPCLLCIPLLGPAWLSTLPGVCLHPTPTPAPAGLSVLLGGKPSINVVLLPLAVWLSLHPSGSPRPRGSLKPEHTFQVLAHRRPWVMRAQPVGSALRCLLGGSVGGALRGKLNGPACVKLQASETSQSWEEGPAGWEGSVLFRLGCGSLRPQGSSVAAVAGRCSRLSRETRR